MLHYDRFEVALLSFCVALGLCVRVVELCVQQLQAGAAPGAAAAPRQREVLLVQPAEELEVRRALLRRERAILVPRRPGGDFPRPRLPSFHQLQLEKRWRVRRDASETGQNNNLAEHSELIATATAGAAVWLSLCSFRRGYSRVGGHVVPEEGELPGQVPAADGAAAARARAAQRVAQVPRVRVAQVGPLAPHLRHCATNDK